LSSDQTPPFITRANLFAAAFFVVLLLLLYLTAHLLAPFSSALLWAAVLVLALHPIYRKVLMLLGNRPAAAAAVMTLLTLLFVIGPMTALLAVLATQAVELYQWTAEGIKSGAAAGTWSRLADYVSGNILSHPLLAGLDIKAMIFRAVGQISSAIGNQLGAALQNTLLIAVNLVIMLISVFFFFRNGEAYYRTAQELLPFSRERQQSIAGKLHDTFTAVVNGVMLIALVQGIMTGIGFALFGVPFPVLWGFFAAVLSLLPVGGATLVWLPGVFFLMLSGEMLHGTLLAVWGVVLVTLPDNILKPLLIGRKAKLPMFFLFLGILGGLKAYGFLGILFGPLIVTLLAALIQIYREEYTGR
jgi:predicted PurR-regulated permease PerM